MLSVHNTHTMAICVCSPWSLMLMRCVYIFGGCVGALEKAHTESMMMGAMMMMVHLFLLLFITSVIQTLLVNM
jgi:hypothetical protein